MKSKETIYLSNLVTSARHYHIDRGFPIDESFIGIQTMINTYLEDKGLPSAVTGVVYATAVEDVKKEHTESYQLKLMNDKVDTLIEILGTSTIAKPGPTTMEEYIEARDKTVPKAGFFK